MYSEDEVAAAVNQFLLQRVEVPRLHGGSRDVEALQQRVFDLVSIALMMRPDSYFYVVWLARNRALALVRQQRKRLAYIDSVGPGTLRPSVPIESTALLVNAEAALLSLNAGLNARSAGVNGDIGPAVDRFRRSVETFARTELTKNVVVQNTVVPTAAELRTGIASTWAGAVETHEEIVALCEGISEAVSRLGAVQLPARTVRDVVGRIHDRLTALREDLDSSKGVAASRLALLDLLSMRSVLTKAAGFRPPSLILAPAKGGSAPATLLDSPGPLARLVGSVSGPFHVTDAVTVDVGIDGINRTPVVLGDTRAELRSGALVLPGGAGTIELAVEVNGALNSTTFDLSSFGSGVALAGYLEATMADLDVTWDSGTSQLVLREAVPTDPGALQVLIDSPSREGILLELWVGSPMFMTASPVSSDEVATQLNAQLTDATASVVTRQYFRGEASISGTTLSCELGAESNWSVISSRIVSFGTNYQALGARAGHTLAVTDGITEWYYTITEVRGGRITVTTDLDLTGVTEMSVGFRLDDVPVGARVLVGADAGVGNGFYRRAPGGSGGFELELETPVPGYVGTADVLLFTSFVALETKTSTTSSGLEVSTATDGNTALGFDVGTSLPMLSMVEVTADLLALGVRPGDFIELTGPDGTAQHTATDVQAHRMAFTPPRPYTAGVWSYTVRNARYSVYEPMRVEAASFAQFPPADIRRIDTEVGRLIRGAQYTGSLIQGSLTNYDAVLGFLELALAGYSVPRELGIEAILRTLEEQGMARALDKLTRLEIVEFFSMSPDGTSFSTHMMQTMAKTVRTVTPTHKNARSQFGVSTGRTTGRVVDPYTAGDADSE